MKKSFKGVNPALQFITQPEQVVHNAQNTPDAQEEQQVQETQQKHEVQEEQETHREQQAQITHDTPNTPDTPKTQGKKGEKLPRINMAFSPDNLSYLQLIGRIDGVSMTEYVNRLIRVDKAIRARDIERAREVLKGGK